MKKTGHTKQYVSICKGLSMVVMVMCLVFWPGCKKQTEEAKTPTESPSATNGAVMTEEPETTEKVPTATPKVTPTKKPTATPKPTVAPKPLPENNIVSNATFDTDVTGWGLYQESGGNGAISSEDGKLALKVTSLGKVNYAVQIYPDDVIELEKDKTYCVRYEISCTVPRSIEVMIQQNGGSYQSYTWKKVDLKPETLFVEYTFDMTSATDTNTKLVFNCGTQGKDLEEHTIFVDNVSVSVAETDYGKQPEEYEPAIRTNQIGYEPDSRKTAVLCDLVGAKEFSVVDAETGVTVYTGEVYGEKYTKTANEINGFGDFSEVKTAGRYYILCGETKSPEFEIRSSVYDTLVEDLVRMFYLQRCGCEVTDDSFGHGACHTGPAKLYGTEEVIDVTGGWHDAGDYGRYVVPAAKSVADMLYAYEAMGKPKADSTGIPESGNGTPDLLDEVRYELEWMLKMQAEDGGVYHKVSCATFPGYIMPEKETGQLIVTPVSTTATADFCGAMALAYEFYYDVDRTFAEACLAAAQKAWGFLEENPKLIFSNPTGISTGSYDDTDDKDERYWAGAQMYRATKEQKYLTYVNDMAAKPGLDWRTVADYGNIAILTMENVDKESAAYTKAYRALMDQAERFEKNSSANTYGTANSSFGWGSNMTVSNNGVILGLAYKLTGEEKYLTAARSQLDYLLGVNPLGTCFVTGHGTVSPKNPHHRPSMAKNQAMPGMLVGGVDSGLEDPTAKARLKDAPIAKRYIDHKESYSTNEITIYWNSPCVYLISLICGK